MKMMHSRMKMRSTRKKTHSRTTMKRSTRRTRSMKKMRFRRMMKRSRTASTKSLQPHRHPLLPELLLRQFHPRHRWMCRRLRRRRAHRGRASEMRVTVSCCKSSRSPPIDRLRANVAAPRDQVRTLVPFCRAPIRALERGDRPLSGTESSPPRHSCHTQFPSQALRAASGFAHPRRPSRV